MSDSIRAWLDHTHKLDREAFDGPWAWELDGADRTTMTTHGKVPFTLIDGDEYRGATEDAEWIAHARTALPAAIAAIQAVLDLHQPEPFTNGRDYCTECYEDHGHDGAIPVLFPCPTVRAITAELTSHQHPTSAGSSGK